MQPIHYRVTHAQNLIYHPPIKTYDKKNPKRNFTFLIIIALCSCIYLFNNSRKPFIKYDENGMAKLAEWRQDKLTKELDDLEQAEQYVLIAKTTGYFPCFSCPTKQLIRLNKGEIWKYGFTSKGKAGRYSSSLEGKNLIYVIQFTGTIEACLKEERKKIYYYALLPGNLKRKLPLIRPPGNKQDS